MCNVSVMNVLLIAPLQVCHGDIKLENVMVTSWNWLLLADFASIKPTYLPEDNPADFSYFFDTSRRRTCYIAPERFKARRSQSGTDIRAQGQEESVPLPSDQDQISSQLLTDTAIDGGVIETGDLTPAMDIFSVGKPVMLSTIMCSVLLSTFRMCSYWAFHRFGAFFVFSSALLPSRRVLPRQGVGQNRRPSSETSAWTHDPKRSTC